jgi:hypothetical protein
VGVVSGNGFSADLHAMVTSSMQLQNTKEFLYGIASGTAGDLASTAGMAGDDDLARTFAAKYEPAARTVVDGIGRAGEGIWSSAHRLMQSATNYLRADDAGASALLDRMPPGPVHVPGGARSGDCEPSNASASLPAVAEYWQFLAAEQGVKSNVRYIP